MQVIKYTHEQLLKMSVDGQDAIAKLFTKAKANIAKDQDAYSESGLSVGKLLCVLEVRMHIAQEANLIGKNVSLKEYFKAITGDVPTGHVMTLKNSFGSFVLTGLITESDYDFNSANCLELAGKIVVAVKGDLTNPAVVSAAKHLKERSKKERSLLQDILDGLIEEKPMTDERALEIFGKIVRDGKLNLVLSILGDEFHKWRVPGTLGRFEEFQAVELQLTRFLHRFGEEMVGVRSAASKLAAAETPAAPAPAPAPAAETPAAETPAAPAAAPAA